MSRQEEYQEHHENVFRPLQGDRSGLAEAEARKHYPVGTRVYVSTVLRRHALWQEYMIVTGYRRIENYGYPFWNLVLDNGRSLHPWWVMPVEFPEQLDMFAEVRDEHTA